MSRSAATAATSVLRAPEGVWAGALRAESSGATRLNAVISRASPRKLPSRGGARDDRAERGELGDACGLGEQFGFVRFEEQEGGGHALEDAGADGERFGAEYFEIRGG